ncbi:MAG: hypothetical protein M1834_004276 [Cirrosporium novae-zelandiae]|nr:MAG: hypothetical protein M1834_004276 [Cirrosporium novae-zelandiae]
MCRATEPTTTEYCINFAKEKGFKPESEVLDDGTTAHWLGKTDAKYLIYYLHGGGFACAANTGHLKFLWEAINQPNLSASVSILLLDYGKQASKLHPYSNPHLIHNQRDLTGTPQTTFPRQLSQCITMLTHILTLRPASQILLSGDSAGANMILGLLSQITHPSPILPPFSIASKFPTACLICPWGIFQIPSGEEKACSFVRNMDKDYINAMSLENWSGAYLEGQKANVYNQPFLAEKGWWEASADVVEDVLILGGEDEVLLDAIRAFSERFSSEHPHTTVAITKNEVHDSPMADYLFGGKEIGDQALLFRKWVREHAV